MDTFKNEVFKIMLKIFPALREMEYKGNICTGRDVRDALINTSQPELCKLTIGGHYSKDKVMGTFDIGEAARNFPKLEELEVSCCNIMISDANQQFDLPCLQKLELKDVKIDDNVGKILASKLPIRTDYVRVRLHGWDTCFHKKSLKIFYY